MITPHKLLDLDHSVLNVAGAIITTLLKDRIYAYDELYSVVTKKGSLEEVKYVFPLALAFLFVIGRIEYDPQDDLIEIVVTHRA